MALETQRRTQGWTTFAAMTSTAWGSWRQNVGSVIGNVDPGANRRRGPLLGLEALHQLIRSRVEDGSFGYKFLKPCPDGAGPCGCDSRMFETIARGEIPAPGGRWLRADYESRASPETLTILDLVEFCARSIAKPTKNYHEFFGHYHFDFERNEGLGEFVADVNHRRRSAGETLFEVGHVASQHCEVHFGGLRFSDRPN